MKDATHVWGWTHVALGAAGVIGVCLCYALAPDLAVGPDMTVNLEAARAAALGDTGAMRIAGILGVLTDPIVTIGAFALAAASKDARIAHGFYWLGACALIFTFVDWLVGFGLRASAQSDAFFIVKPLFDALIAGASFAYGVSAILIAWPSRAAIGPRILTLPLFVFGLLLAGVSAAVTMGAGGLGRIVGLGIAALTIFYLALAITQLAQKRPATSPLAAAA